MELSVVLPALNDRDRLVRALDALADRVPAAETIVVNGPSVDGTSGTVRDRTDVDVLVEVDDRGVNVARNAGIARARGDVIALLAPGLAVEEGWYDAVRETFAGSEAPAAATGPTCHSLRGGRTAPAAERTTVAGREVLEVDGGNAAFDRAALEAIDGFDEYLPTGGARDAAHRLAAADRPVEWVPSMAVRGELAADGGPRQWPVPPADGRTDRAVAWPYRAQAYRLAKNYGPGRAAIVRVARRAVADGAAAFREVLGGDAGIGEWVAEGRRVLGGALTGLRDGSVARLRDRPEHNPEGLTARADRAVAVYDRR